MNTAQLRYHNNLPEINKLRIHRKVKVAHNPSNLIKHVNVNKKYIYNLTRYQLKENTSYTYEPDFFDQVRREVADLPQDSHIYQNDHEYITSLIVPRNVFVSK